VDEFDRFRTSRPLRFALSDQPQEFVDDILAVFQLGLVLFQLERFQRSAARGQQRPEEGRFHNHVPLRSGRNLRGRPVGRGRGLNRSGRRRCGCGRRFRSGFRDLRGDRGLLLGRRFRLDGRLDEEVLINQQHNDRQDNGEKGPLVHSYLQNIPVFSFHRVVPAGVQGVATQNSLHPEECPLEGAVTAHGVD